MEEKVIETKICRFCSTKFDITDKDLEFYDKVSPVFNGTKYQIPTPILCPDCRQQRRLTFRNERNLYKRKCDATGRSIISNYSPDKQYKIYAQDEWWSDKWDPLDYGPADGIDFSKSFFEQFNELYHSVPIISLITDYTKDENSPYTNYAGSNKNCYMIFDSDFNRDSIYLTSSTKNENCIDCHSTHNSRFCYQTIGVENCYKCFYTNNSVDCNECYECDSCIGCKNCFGCTNLRNAEYHILNKEYSKEDYLREILELEKTGFRSFLEYPKKFMLSNKIEKVTGNYIYNSKNISDSYEMYNSEDCKYCFGMHDLKSSYDVSGFGIGGLEKIYDSHVVGVGGYNVLFSNIVVGNCSNVFYSNNIYNNSSNIFGCIGLVSKEYCILNKQYTKEEYESLVPKIIEHMIKTKEWGEFFPSSISPFGYNETVAMEYYPLSSPGLNSSPGMNLSDLECMRSFPTDRFKWSTYESPFPKVDKVIPADKLPDDISNVPDDILNWAIECEVTGKPFRIIKQELEFYRKHNLPIPKRHPDQRHLDRMKLRNPRKLYDRLCDKCQIDIKTTYSPDREEIVYCEECYLKEVV